MSDLDPTQQGGPELQPAHAGRNAALAEIAKRAHEEIAPDLKAFNEATGEIAQDEPKSEPEPQAQAEEPEQQEEAPVEAKPAAKMVQIVVHGQTIEVPEDKIIEAGRRTLQKESAADKLLQQAAEKERQAEAMLRQAQQRLSGQQPDATQQQAPSSDAPPFDPNQLVTAVSGVVSQNLRLERAREVFDSEFPEIASDPVLLGYAARLEQDRLDHAAAVGEPLGDPVAAYRKHGETVRKWLQERTGNKPAVPQDKQERKRTITSVQAANARAPAPQEKKPMTTSEIIEQQRLARRGRQIQPNR
jgi:hypothetical protein